jgi:hypothetical protein
MRWQKSIWQAPGGWSMPPEWPAAPEVAKIGVGRDAADIPFLSSFGSAELLEQVVSVSRIS